MANNTHTTSFSSHWQWSYSTDTLQIPDDSKLNGSVTVDWQDDMAGLYLDEDHSVPDDSETRTITDTPSSKPTRGDVHPSGTIATFFGPTAADTANPNLFILTFEQGDLLNNTLCTPDRRAVYTISTRAASDRLNQKSKGATALITSLCKVGSPEVSSLAICV